MGREHSLRARYYNPRNGRFTQQDTYMGNNFDPTSLHKYLYANADPINYTDPTGNFSLAGMMSTVNTVATLASRASTVYSVFQIATGEQEFSSKEAGIAILWRLLGSKINILTGPIQKLLRKMGCLLNSFAEDTLISTNDGLVEIQNVQIGDLVLTYNEKTGEEEYKPVIHMITTDQVKETLSIELSDGNIIKVTLEHLIYVDGHWIAAEKIQVGQTLYSLGKNSKVVNVSVSKTKVKVYNLTVQDNHNYFVGKDRVLAHNISACEKTARAIASRLRKSCKKMFACKDFARKMENVLLKKDVKGKRICLKSKAGIWSNGNKTNITDTGDHVAIQVGDLVFDNLYPEGIPLAEWIDDFGGGAFVQPGGNGSGSEIELYNEALGSESKCK